MALSCAAIIIIIIIIGYLKLYNCANKYSC